MKYFTAPLQELKSYQTLLDAVEHSRTPVLLTGAADSAKTHLSYSISHHLNRPFLLLTHSELKAREICADMQYFLKDRVKLYPSKDIVFYVADIKSREIIRDRFSVISSLFDGGCAGVVMSIEALFDKLLPPDILKQYILTLTVGDSMKIELLCERLVFMGYERAALVEVQGQFAVRGGILDLFPSTAENAVRIEFWDDEIDSIRLLDQFSQRSIEKVETMRVFPIRELVYGQEQIDNAIQNMRKELAQTVQAYDKKGLKAEKTNLQNNINETIEQLTENKSFSGVDKYLPFFYDEYVSFLRYMPQDAVVILDEPSKVDGAADTVLAEFYENVKSHITKGTMLPSQSGMVFSYADIQAQLGAYPLVLMSTFAHTLKTFKPKEIVDFVIKSTSVVRNTMDTLEEDLRYKLNDGFRIVFLGGPRMRCERLVRELSERDLPVQYAESADDVEIKKNVITILKGSLANGFEYPENKFAVLCDKEIFGSEKIKKKKKKKTNVSQIESFTELKLGDYIVHENHGIGLFKGIEKITIDKVSKDYIKIGYQDEGNLYVPINQLDMVQKYVGSESAAPKVNKLGGADWQKAKSKARQSAKTMAIDLVKLYATRQATKGYVYTKDTVWQKEFEETFLYDETDDQLNAIADVKADMESYKVMDRLVCGDVGYGKTEVALRAAFKAAQDGKQVAYIVPTTILAQQHFNTFNERMQNFPVVVEMLSRFCTPKKQKEVISGLGKGLVDIVIGTHRLLSKDIAFRDLGMIIIDEEQRFGVTHKEKLKNLKGSLDVLTLTATPIPRTLHMSLVGIRDMSVLEEPPNERMPIQTYVMEYNDEMIRSAIARELARGGQVYYLHNRVRNIMETTSRLQNLIPEARISYAHGQLSERELEKIMVEFINHEIDVLVCTTIIETGLDIPNVNTIIINDADRMGLSQLYQLRGRVGRSNRSSFAYLMYKKDKVLNEVAEKRLQAIKEFTELGSGFKISMRDLEIRGAGNLIGAEQHGHMEAIGYDLYCKLLDRAIKELKGEVSADDFETLIDININAFIPSSFIENEEQKINIYKKIAAMGNEADRNDVWDEIEDRYGNLPRSVENLLDISVLKADAHRIGIVSVIQRGEGVRFTFRHDAAIDPARIMHLVKESPRKLSFKVSESGNYLLYKIEDTENLTFIKGLRAVVSKLNGGK